MRRGCVSLGEIRCDSCQRLIPTAGRYLIADESVGENGTKKIVRYCSKCCEEKGLIGYRNEKEEKILTFFPPDERTVEVKAEENTGEIDRFGKITTAGKTEMIDEAEEDEEDEEEAESEEKDKQ
jgi:hypothetical protein